MTQPPPWRLVRKGQVHDYTILTVREDQVEDPRNHSLHPRVRIEAPDWVNIIPVTTGGEVVFVRQFRFGIWADTLEIPGGIVDPGETPEQAAVRELREESGFRPGRVIALGSVHPNPALQNNRSHSFLAVDCVPEGAPSPEATEDLRVELHPKSAVDQLIREGAVTHSLVVTAFLLERLRDGRR